MRMIIFFDLPMITKSDLAEYRRFRKFLIRNGFIMMQESVYSRLVLNGSSFNLLKIQVEKNLPSSGLIQMLQVTEKQYSDIVFFKGKSKSNVIDSDKRIVILWK